MQTEDKTIKISEQTKEVRARIWWIWVFFVLSLVAGVWCYQAYKIIGIFFVCFSFLVFNGIMLLYKMIILSTKRLKEELQCPSPIQR